LGNAPGEPARSRSGLVPTGNWGRSAVVGGLSAPGSTIAVMPSDPRPDPAHERLPPEPTLESSDPTSTPRPAQAARVAANRLGLDYRREAALLPALPYPIIDFHAHINGRAAAAIYRDVARLFGIDRVYTMVRLEEAATVREVLGDTVRFIAFQNFRHADKGFAFRQGFLDDIPVFHERFGARIVKLWNAPRMWEMFPDAAGADLVPLDSEWRVRQSQLAQSLGMMMMVHVADPDTWFATRYADWRKYQKKADHYRPLEAMLDRFPMQWIAAHMGGSPEDLGFLDGLLERHPNLYLDTSATKWIVRELSKHPPERVVEFMTRWRGRVIFGSDIVTTDEHLAPKEGTPALPMADLANSPESAFELYASRYYALRTMWETDYDGESPIADPDLKMVDPVKHGDLDGPRLRGLRLAPDLLRTLYRDAAVALMATVGTQA